MSYTTLLIDKDNIGPTLVIVNIQIIRVDFTWKIFTFVTEKHTFSDKIETVWSILLWILWETGNSLGINWWRHRGFPWFKFLNIATVPLFPLCPLFPGLSYLLYTVLRRVYLNSENISENNPANTPWPNAGLMLAHRLRRWSNISPTFCVFLLGILP